MHSRREQAKRGQEQAAANQHGGNETTTESVFLTCFLVIL
jgi:hypothetical protein